MHMVGPQVVLTVILKVCLHVSGGKKLLRNITYAFTVGPSCSCLIIKCLIPFEGTNPKENKHFLQCPCHVAD